MDNPSYTTELDSPTVHTNGYKNGNLNTGSAKNTPQDPNKVITVLGSGDYGRAISGRLVRSGYTVYIGSRDPQRSTVQTMVSQTGAILMNQDEAIASSQVIIIAVGRDYYDKLPLNALKDKVVIDVSNNTVQRKGPHYRSNAEYLQGLLPDSSIVKGFNVLSAYALENGGLQGSKEVYIAGDNSDAKARVSQICRDMSFTPVDWGGLKAARDIEDVPLKLMPSWKRPVAVTFGVFSFIWILALISFQICPNASSGDWSQNWKNLALVNFNRVIAICALWTLSFCYLPGLLAAYIQLWRGTKYSRFPKWMDDWLKMRKQLGLLMLGMASVHGCISVGYISPKETQWVYEAPTVILATVVKPNGTVTENVSIFNDEFNWRGELFLTLGALALCLTIVLGITSLPSVTATLSWREFTFIQSKLGWVTLIIASLHDIFLAWNYMFLYWGCGGVLPIGPQYALYAPLLCVILKIPLLIPPIDNYLQKIRKGYERNPTTTEKALP